MKNQEKIKKINLFIVDTNEVEPVQSKLIFRTTQNSNGWEYDGDITLAGNEIPNATFEEYNYYGSKTKWHILFDNNEFISNIHINTKFDKENSTAYIARDWEIFNNNTNYSNMISEGNSHPGEYLIEYNKLIKSTGLIFNSISQYNFDGSTSYDVKRQSLMEFLAFKPKITEIEVLKFEKFNNLIRVEFSWDSSYKNYLITSSVEDSNGVSSSYSNTVKAEEVRK